MNSATEKLRKIPVRQTPHPDYINRKKNAWIVKLEKFIYQHREKLLFVHISMFIGFLILMIVPLFLPAPMHGDTPWKNFTEFSQFMIWGLWFPLVFISVLFSGRSWCGILCPMGAASEWTNRIGLKMKIPAWLKWEGTPVLSFIIITILGQTVDVRDEASAMAEIFGGTLLLALTIGFLFGKGGKKRAWCRHVCPIGLLLGVFSRMGIVQFSPKQIHAGKDRYTEKGICPTMIAVSQKNESRHCIECFRCVKPQSPGGLFVRLRKLGEEVEQIRKHNPNLAEIWFIFLSTGLSLGGFLWLILPSYQTLRQTIGVWFIEHGYEWIGSAGPSWLMSVHPEQNQIYNWLDFFMITGFMMTCMIGITLMLVICTAICSHIAKRVGGTGTFKERFTELGYQFTPIAMMSIIISLGDKLFQTFINSGISHTSIGLLKGACLLVSLGWSITLGYRILRNQGITQTASRYYALLPGAIGSIFTALAWWPAVFGITL